MRTATLIETASATRPAPAAAPDPSRPAPTRKATLATLLAAGGVVAGGTPAAAGIYLEGAVGFVSSSPNAIFDDDDAGDDDFDVDFDADSVFYGAVGLEAGLIRSELELSFRDSDVDNFRVSGGGPQAGSGSFDTVSLMTNLYLDVPLPLTGFSVWAGGGAGVVQFDGEVQSVSSLDDADFDDAGYGFAWQVRAGVSYDLTRNLTVNAGYRYWRAGEVDFSNVTLDETELHTVDLGLRLTF